MADKRIDIVELTPTSFRRWYNDVHVALIFAKCNPATDFEERPNEIDEADWEKMSNNARAIILKALRDDFWRIAPNDSPYQALRKIESAFQPTSSLITVLNISKFFALTQGVGSSGLDIVKEITSTYAELRRCIEASDALRGRIIIDESLRTAVLAFALEKSEPAAAQQIKERFERAAITFEQAVSLLAEAKISTRSHISGTPTVAANTDGCSFCHGRHPLSKCWFNNPDLAPDRLRGKICVKCKSVGHNSKECKGKASANTVSENEKYCFGLRHNVYTAATSGRGNPFVILDSGCTIHMMSTKDIFSKYVPGSPEGIPSVFTASGESLPVVGHGSVTFQIENLRSKKRHELFISEVLHVPQLKECILSVSTLDRKGIEFTTAGGKTIMRYKGKFLASAPLNPDLQQYCLNYAN
tara:strand:- start:1391 stop:2632 length:1242 start_codon:yes stop_codon:yes gene_type:complete